MKNFKLHTKTIIICYILLAIVFNSQAQIKFTEKFPVEIFRVNYNSTEIIFAGQKYIKQKIDMNVNGNIGIGTPNSHDMKINVSDSVGLMPFGWSPSEKLIITSDSIIHVEPKPIGNSKPMKQLNVFTNDSIK